MKVEISHWIEGHILFSVDAISLKAALEIAVESGANLEGANLEGANLKGARLETGETLAEYIEKVMPAFLTAGGKTLAEVAAGWDCHYWDNCPTAIAFGCHSMYGVPKLLRPRAEQFIRLFDARFLPNPIQTEPDAPA